MLTGPQIVAAFDSLGITHVVWLPDSALGPWEADFERASHLQLVRVCREGEAWAIAAGLCLGGCRPIVIIQNTGLFESGDAMRNVLFDLGLPLWAIIGYRSYLVLDSSDTAKKFTEPILEAWGIDSLLLENPGAQIDLISYLSQCRSQGKPGFVLLPEGRM